MLDTAGMWLPHCVFLFILTFVYEDAAIVAAAFAKVDSGLPMGLAFMSVYTGVIASDLSIYGLGRAARKNAWLQARIVGPAVDRTGNWLNLHLFRLIFLARITPGLLFPSFAACGWFRLPFRRFALISLASATVYTPFAMALATFLGESLFRHLGRWAWGLAVLFLLAGTIRSRWHGSLHFGSRQAIRAENPGRHRGMPSLDRLSRLIARAERIPASLFYIPAALHWLWLALRYRSLTLPTVANPAIETGGFWGESKSACMDQIKGSQRLWLAEYVSFVRGMGEDISLAIELMAGKELSFPVVAKPDIGWQGYGVRLLEDREALRCYLAGFPVGERLILQRAVLDDGEAGVFYARMPGEEHGSVFSLTFRYFPFVVGDGRSTLRQLVLGDPRAGWKARYHLGLRPEHEGLDSGELERVPGKNELVRLAFIGSIRVGGLYRDMRHLVTPELARRFDAIAKSMQDFYFGRFDIRFESLEKLRAGEGFSIIEINGAGAEAIHVWDPEIALGAVYRELFSSQDMMFEIAAKNRARGFKPMGFFSFLAKGLHQHRLLKRYPPSG